MKRKLLGWYAIAIVVPIAGKLGLPPLISTGLQWWEAIHHAPNPPLETVESIQGIRLTVRTTQGTPQSVQLFGLTSLPARWQQVATGVVAALIQSSHNRVAVINLPDSVANPKLTLVQLPNGTSIQQILLMDGLAKLDEQALAQLPLHLRVSLQQAQTLAQEQHKNIWGNE